jgi:hypothetical protein
MTTARPTSMKLSLPASINLRAAALLAVFLRTSRWPAGRWRASVLSC